MVKAYLILANESWVELMVSVNQAIRDNWQPMGGISISPSRIAPTGMNMHGINFIPGTEYVQALVKYEEPS